MATITQQELAGLLTEAGHAHHQAYEESDGVDPEWAIWYAPFLQTRLGGRLGCRVTRSEIIYLLQKAQREHEAVADGGPWADHYAGVLLSG